MIEYLEDKNLFKHISIVFDTRTDNEERTQWLSQRCNSIGGSEAAKAINRSKYGSALQLYSEKLGLIEKFKGNKHTEFGIVMEETIKDWFQKRFKQEQDITLKIYNYPYMFTNKEYPFMSGNIDGIGILDKDYNYYTDSETGEVNFIPANTHFGIEIKTASAYNYKEWLDSNVPDDYIIQCMYYMMLTGLDHFLIICLIDKELKYQVISRNEELINFIKNGVIDFWNGNILPKNPPPPSGLPCDDEIILNGQVLNEDKVINLKENILEQYQNIDERIKHLTKEKNKLKQTIHSNMKNCIYGEDKTYKIKRFVKSGRNTIDTDKLKKDYPNIYKELLKKGSDSINIKISKL